MPAIRHQPRQRGTRWVQPFMGGSAVGVSSQVFTAGRVQLGLCEVTVPGVVEALVYIVGGTSAGNVIMGLYGPVVTEETALDAPVVVESAATAQGAINVPQVLTVTNTLIMPGRYYIGLEGSDATGTFMRHGNQQQVAGWGMRYDRSGGFGAFTNPCPAVTNTGSELPAMRMRMAA